MTVDAEQIQSTVRAVLAEFGKLQVPVDDLAPDANLMAAGLTSFASMNVLLGLEDAFDVEFPDTMVERSLFASLESLATAVETLLAEDG